MKSFQFLLQCAFVSDGSAKPSLGFFVTVFLQSADLRSAVDRIPRVLRRCLNEQGLRVLKEGVFRTRCRIVEIYELPEAQAGGDQQPDGVTFFPMGPIERIRVLLDFLYREWAYKHLIVEL